ncbi:MAG: sensor domain-containing diguanylate cyclase [Pseudomonadota bacterium]
MFLFAAFNARARGFGFYVPHAICLLAYQGMLDGTLIQHLGIDNNWWDSHGAVILAWLIMVTGLAFTASFLDIEHRMPLLSSWLDGAEITLLLGLGASLLAPTELVFPLLLPVVIGYGLVVSCTGLYAMRRRVPLAGAYTVGTLLLLFGVELSVLNQFGLVGYRIAIGDAMLVGILLQAIVLGWALAQHLREARHARRAAQQEALARQEEALAAQHRITQQMEARVNERSNALWQAMRQLEHTHRQLSDLSRRDGLTGVHNRRYFDERYPELVQLASRHERPLAVLLIDVDHFKKLNDQRGHAVGDECLRLIASTLRDVVSRSTDLVARYGGEEFVVVLPETSQEGALAIAESLRAAVAQLRVSNDNSELKFSISVGVVMHTPDPGEDGRKILTDADAALYRAKHNGRNRVEATIE